MKSGKVHFTAILWFFLIFIISNHSIAITKDVNAIIDFNNNESNLQFFKILDLSNSKSEIDVLHLFSHGRPGELLIDGVWKCPNEIAVFLKTKLTSNITRVNIYGCEFAKGSIGKNAVKYLENNLKVSISASDDITGIDGDWDLEVGQYNSAIALSNFTSNLQCASGRIYSAYVYWRTIAAPCNAVNYVVNHGSTQIVTNINQGVRPNDITYNGFDWELVASNIVPTSSGTFTIRLRPDVSTCTSGTIVADAVLVVDNFGNRYIVDNNLGFSNGAWTPSNGNFTLDYNGTMVYISKTSAVTGNYFDWVFNERYQLPDNDYDSIVDVCDYDDDNDGILDGLEDFNIVCTSTNLGVEYYNVGTAFANFGTGIAPITDYFSATQNGLPWFPPDRLPSSPTNVNNSTVSPPDASTTAGEMVVRDYTLNFGCHSNVKFQLRSTSSTDYNSLYMSIGGTRSNATQVAYLGSSQLSSTYTTAANPGNSLIYLRHYLVDDNGSADGQIFWTSDQQLTPILLEASTLPCGAALCQHKDTDGDGMPDYLDRDSDNDGCSDAIEGGKLMTVNNVGAYQNLTGSVDNNGVPIVVGASGQGIGSSTNAAVQDAECNPCNSTSSLYTDNDLDMIADYCDIDDDNDGILDETECPTITGEFRGTFGIGDVGNTTFCRNLQAATLQNYSYNCGLPTAPSPAATYGVVDGLSAGYWHPNWNGQKGHTTRDPQDAFLAINGALQVGIFYSQNISMAAGVTYSFGLYAANANDGASWPTEIGIRLKNSNGTILHSFTTGNLLNRFEWKNAGGIFTPTVSGTFKLEVYNIYTNGAGNDFSIDDIYFTPLNGCPDYDHDGTPDYLDRDSDNDGCPDAIEGDSTFTYANLNTSNTLNGGVYPTGLSTQLMSSTVGQGAGTSVDTFYRAQPCVNPDTIVVVAPSTFTYTTQFKVCATKDQVKGKLTYTFCGLPANTYPSTTVDSNGCVFFTSNPSVRNPVFTCIIAIDEKGIRDSTVIIILPSERVFDIKISPLQAAVLDCQVYLNWTIFGTKDASHIEIQRSDDMSNFKIIGSKEVPANSNIPQKMEYIDRTIGYGNNKYYYRLKLVDLDSSFDYSETIYLNSSCGTERQIAIAVTPNPSHGKFQALISSMNMGLGKLTILNSMGQIIEIQDLNINQSVTAINLDLSDNSDGLYILNFQDSKGNMEHISLIKN